MNTTLFRDWNSTISAIIWVVGLLAVFRYICITACRTVPAWASTRRARVAKEVQDAIHLDPIEREEEARRIAQRREEELLVRAQANPAVVFTKRLREGVKKHGSHPGIGRYSGEEWGSLPEGQDIERHIAEAERAGVPVIHGDLSTAVTTLDPLCNARLEHSVAVATSKGQPVLEVTGSEVRSVNPVIAAVDEAEAWKNRPRSVHIDLAAEPLGRCEHVAMLDEANYHAPENGDEIPQDSVPVLENPEPDEAAHDEHGGAR